jgi:hypothetical protein
MAQYEDLTIDQGADVAVELALFDKDGSVKDLTGYSASAKMKRSYNADSDNTQAFTTFIDTDAPENGVLVLELSNTATDTLKAGRWVYDVEISYVDSDGDSIIERVLEGNIQVTPSVTR